MTAEILSPPGLEGVDIGLGRDLPIAMAEIVNDVFVQEAFVANRHERVEILVSNRVTLLEPGFDQQ